MNKGIIFIAGLAIGSGITYFSLKNRYERVINEEVNSLRENYKKKYDSVSELAEKITKDYARADVDIQKIVEDNKYDTTDKYETSTEDKVISPSPYIIGEEEFASTSFNEKASLTFYEGDEILTDDDDKIINNIDELIGYSNIDYFNRYDVDVIHVRNERLSIDYEVVRDTRSYSDYIGE